MMNFQCVSNYFLRFATSLTNIIISTTCSPLIFFPVRAIIAIIATFPRRTIRTVFVRGLPFPHTFSATKIKLFLLSISAPEFFPTPLTMKKFASPTKSNKQAFSRTINFVFFSKSIGFNCKQFIAYRTSH